jgi:hypothetical protein
MHAAKAEAGHAVIASRINYSDRRRSARRKYAYASALSGGRGLSVCKGSVPVIERGRRNQLPTFSRESPEALTTTSSSGVMTGANSQLRSRTVCLLSILTRARNRCPSLPARTRAQAHRVEISPYWRAAGGIAGKLPR